MRIVAGSDHAGFHLKQSLIELMRAQGHDVLDLGTHSTASTDYPTYGHQVARAVARGEAQMGLLICGSGVGMSITANRHHGVRAVVCSETYSARMARAHNDANVLCLGERVVTRDRAEEIAVVFLETPFESGRHARRIAQIEQPE